MADLEAVLADVSYLMAMEKSKSSTSSTKNGRRLTLPDRDSAHVIRRYLTERDLLQFQKVFNERLGFELFAAFCKRKKFNQKAHFHVPMLFYKQIEGFSAFWSFLKSFQSFQIVEYRARRPPQSSQRNLRYFCKTRTDRAAEAAARKRWITRL